MSFLRSLAFLVRHPIRALDEFFFAAGCGPDEWEWEQ